LAAVDTRGFVRLGDFEVTYLLLALPPTDVGAAWGSF
jgi:hypothetical protein